MATVYEIVNGISQAMTLSHDGALDSDGEPVKIGLKREEGDPILDSRIIDGFKCKISGNKLILNYQCEINMKDAHDKNFESDIKETIGKCAKWLKSEYKKITKNALTLSENGETDILIQATSRVRVWVEATQIYIIAGIKNEYEQKRTVDGAIKNWLQQTKGKKPDNVTAKKDTFKHFEPWNIQKGIRNK